MNKLNKLDEYFISSTGKNMKKRKKIILSPIANTTLIGLGGVLLLSALLYSEASLSASEKLSKVSGIQGPIGSAFEGLSLDFNAENVSCHGLFNFDCKITDAQVNIPSLNQKLLSIQDIQINNLSKSGFTSNRRVNVDLQLNSIYLSDEAEIMDGITKTGFEINQLLTPFSIGIKVNSRTDYDHKGSQSDVFASIKSKIANVDISGKVLTILNKENTVYIDENLSITKNEQVAVAEKNLGLNTSSTIIKEINLNLKNKSINKFIYTYYKYYFEQASTPALKLKTNLSIIGLNSSELASLSDFNLEITKRFNPMIEHYKSSDSDMSNYLSETLSVITSNYGEFNLTAVNKNNYTVSEISVAKDFGTNPEKYFTKTVISNHGGL